MTETTRTPINVIRQTLFWVVLYGGLLLLAAWFSYDIRFFDANKTGLPAKNLAEIFADRPSEVFWISGIQLACLAILGQFRGILYYFRLRDAIQLVAGLTLAFVILFAIESTHSVLGIPRGVLVVNLNFAAAILILFRSAVRALRERFGEGGQPVSFDRVAIIGAGNAGAQLAAELQARRGHGLRPACFLDDDVAKHGLEIHGVPVLGAPEKIGFLRERLGLTQVILALPTASARRIREVSALSRSAGLRTLVVPSLRELVSGRVRTTDLRPISLEDLLGRDSARLDETAIDAIVQDRVVLVTGAGGSIGSEIARQVAARRPRRILVLDQCEVLLYQIEQELVQLGFGATIVPLVADVTDHARMAAIFAKHKPALVLHAAAHKHVPMMESQPGEAIKNNCLGTETVARLASEHGAERFLLISTDKAINPTNAMGASKRLAEIAVQSHQARPGNRTRFMAVRFGNVLGSSGSVIPLFRKQIAAGGPVTVTHPEVRRYFMTIPEAVGLVLQSAALGEGGEIFVLDMGEPLRMIDVARQLIELSGFVPDKDIQIRIIGLRPGEKLFEELRHEGESFAPTPHPRVFRFVSQPMPFAEIEGFLARIRELTSVDRDACKLGVQQLVPEYTPYLE